MSSALASAAKFKVGFSVSFERPCRERSAFTKSKIAREVNGSDFMLKDIVRVKNPNKKPNFNLEFMYLIFFFIFVSLVRLSPYIHSIANFPDFVNRYE